jgi:MFS family permease
MGLWLGTRGNYDQKGFVVIGGAVMTGLSLAAFALTSEYIGSFPLAVALMAVTGVFTSTYMISIMSSLQMLVPNEMRGRVMGFYGMTWNIMPLGGMFAGALAAATGAPWAVAIGGFIVAGFALGPALMSSQVRNLGQTLRSAEKIAASGA